MERVESKDGTRIACWRAGSGPPLLLVHGGMADHSRWGTVSPSLERHFTVYAMDRRGRGGSDDAPDYAIEREYEDVVAVVEHIGRRAAVVGHSYGATCALGAALLTDRIERLVLYEPGILEGASGFYTTDHMMAVLREAERLLGARENEAAIVLLLRGLLGLSEADIDKVKAEPSWPARVASAHTVLREVRSEGAWVFDPGRYAALTVPTLLLTGSETYPTAKEGTSALAAALPNRRVVVLQGQGHIAITTAPELFVREVEAFLTEPTRSG